ncbi:hypothetical protein Rhe02_30930 [Rhizocola hellebori]|uniref:Nucleotidyltransferase family protein n=2 Tax=Rhizocola hellebori TaxID=1392758 RepID=A0A8J3Q710_9ACTN|nr:hypothetical protein Rhe02_30930 [Rhizocola hellebori]
MIAAAATAFFAFLGFDKIHNQLKGLWNVSEQAVELSYNTLVLVVLIATIANLIYRLPERAAEHHRAIHSLTAFIRDAEDTVELADAGLVCLTTADLEKIRERYKGMTSSLPPSTDKEFLRSKKDYAAKRRSSAAINQTLMDNGGPNTTTDNRGRLIEILRLSHDRLELLHVVETAGNNLWITGGFIRNAVWDHLHGYRVSTPLDDIDVVYFDRDSKVDSHDSVLRLLRTNAPNIDWSLKNQAEMRDPWLPTPPPSLEDALRRFTDTATAVAVRSVDGSLEVLAPYGLEDLFNLVVRPTPGFDASTYNARIEKKNWAQTWPNLTIHRA